MSGIDHDAEHRAFEAWARRPTQPCRCSLTDDDRQEMAWFARAAIAAERERELQAAFNRASMEIVRAFRVDAESKEKLLDLLREAHDAMKRYSMDVDDEPPYAHRALMERIAEVLR